MGQDFQNEAWFQKRGADEIRILALGDCFTAYGGDEAYPAQLQEILNAKSDQNFKVINKATPSLNSLGLLYSLEGHIRQYKPDIVTVMIGFTDTYDPTKRREVNPEELEAAGRNWQDHIRTFEMVRSIVIQLDSYLHAVKEKVMERYVTHVRSQPWLKAYKKGMKRYSLNPRKRKEEWDRIAKAKQLDVLALKTVTPENRFKMCLSYDTVDEVEKALEFCLQVVQDDPNDYRAWYMTGSLYRRQGKIQEAAEAYDSAFAICPSCFSLEDYRSVSNFYVLEARDTVRREKLMLYAIDAYPKDRGAYGALKELYFDQGRYADAEALFQKALKRDAHFVDAYTALNECFKKSGKLAIRAQMLKTAIELNPREQSLYNAMGELLLEVKKYQEAEPFLIKALDIMPETAKVNNQISLYLYDNLIKCYEGQGKMKKVEALRRKVQAIELTQNQFTSKNLEAIKTVLGRNKIQMIAIQYPTRDVEALKRKFVSTDGIIFVENKTNFEEAFKKGSYYDYFIDQYTGGFGHPRQAGHRLLAESLAQAVLDYVKKP